MVQVSLRSGNSAKTSSSTKNAPKIKLKGLSKQDAEKSKGDPALAEAPIEEHFIMRLPPRLTDHLRESIEKRKIPSDLALHFLDSRKGYLKYGSHKYSAHLVDLPCIIESLKTINSKQYYKIADIAQMVVIDGKGVPADYSWPDGITPPLKNVRKARFRQRMNKKVIEDVEHEVERLLMADAEAEDVQYEIHERKEGEEFDFLDEENMTQADESDDGADGGDDLLAEIQEALDADDAGSQGDDKSDSDEDDEEEEEEEEEGGSDDGASDGEPDTEEQIQLKQEANLIKEEIKDLESKIKEKAQVAANQVNPIMKKRFGEIVIKLTKELDIKKEQLLVIKNELESTKEPQAENRESAFE